MPINWKFPTAVELDFVTQEYAGVAREAMIGHQILGLVERNTSRIRWDELDNDKGMTAPVAPDADPPYDQRLGVTTKEYTPYEFGQFARIPRSEIEAARRLGTLGEVLDVTELVTRELTRQLNKVHVRIESLIWSALLGSISIDENGVKISETFPVQTYTAATAWSSTATATPLKDFDAVALLFRGKGASIAGARAYANRKTVNYLLENSNNADIRGLVNLQTTANIGLSEINKVLALRGLPELIQYDEGYYDASGNFTLFIPDNKVIVIGRRAPGEVIGDFVLTRTAYKMVNGEPTPGIWTRVIPPQDDDTNPTIRVGAGFKGGPRIFYPKSIVVMSV
jgi:hypothetical protein